MNNEVRSPATGRASHRFLNVPTIVGLVGIVASATGWCLEWYRQRGTCEFGDNSPDTLAMSVILILVGGGICGVVGVLAFAIGRRRGRARLWLPAFCAPILAIASVVPLFVFAGAGPGSWFQYCAT